MRVPAAHCLATFGLVATLLAAPPAAAQFAPIRDDFEGQGLSPANWFVCERDENNFSIIPAPKGDFRSARMDVKPRFDLGLYAGMFVFAHAECRKAPGGDYVREGYDERAEIWEADSATLEFGTEAWYRFAMYIDPNIPENDVNRLVVGQWKQSGGHSPILAQRFKGRKFTITIEQDFDAPLAYRGVDECRLLIGHERDYPASTSAAVDWPRTTWLAAPETSGGLLTAAVAHSKSDSVRSDAARARPCAKDITVTPLGLLPSPFGTWVTMVYRLKGAPDGTGLVEVWADGQPIARVSGRIGFRDGVNKAQVFKYGPYRNHVRYSSHALLARFARGATRADIEER
jgi:hypothetical protein